jgi:hypothetical protein
MAILVFLCGLWFAFRRQRKGVLKLKLPLIGEISSDTLSVTLILLSVPLLILAHQITVRDRELAAADKSSSEKANFQKLLETVSAQDRGPLFVTMAKQMRNDLAKAGPSANAAVAAAALDRIEATAAQILNVESDNGHGLYFQGEIFRIKGDAVRFRGQFRRFLSVAAVKSPPSFTNHSDAEACYADPAGFCAERIAWVSHLLANDYLRDALSENDPGQKKSNLRAALDDARKAIEVRGKPFEQTSKANIATDVVIDQAEAELAGMKK